MEEEYYNYPVMHYAHFNINMFNYTGTQGIIFFFYVDKNVNISAKGYSHIFDKYSFEHSDVNLSLKAGWNAVYFEETYSNSGYHCITTWSQTVPSRQWMWLLGDW